ncbi:MAG: hypothetical protein ACR2I2_20925 [Bryobacteraceae bacterium]
MAGFLYEFEWAKGERGKFYRPNAGLRLPIYLDDDVQSSLAEQAARKGIPLNEMINGLLKQDIQIIESVK